jgi:hypothetical protein
MNRTDAIAWVLSVCAVHPRLSQAKTLSQLVAAAIRGHWGIDNSLHHMLDVSFGKDHSRIRRNNAAENISRIRRIALNLLKDKGARNATITSIKGRRKLAGWDDQFLLNLIAGSPCAFVLKDESDTGHLDSPHGVSMIF